MSNTQFAIAADLDAAKEKEVDTKVQRFIDAVPKSRRPLFNKLQALILACYPKAEVLIWYGLLTYRTKSGWVALANKKDYVSLYTDSPSHIAGFKAKYPKAKTGKACINFRLTDPIPEVEIKKVVRNAMENKE
jgi:uncharacterized protein YdhG (YjbR/CyaY superfamily)